MSQQTLANMLLIVINAFWGLSYVFMKLGLGSLQAFNIVGLRFLLAFLIAGILFYKRLMLVTKKVIISSFMLGTLLFGVFTFVTFGVSMTSASNAGFLVSLTVIFVPVKTNSNPIKTCLDGKRRTNKQLIKGFSS